MGSAISVPIAIAIACIGGAVLISMGFVALLIVVRRRRDSSRFMEVEEPQIASADEDGNLRSSLEARKQRPRVPSHPGRQLARAFSERSFAFRLRSTSTDQPKLRNVLQRKRYGGCRSTSLPVFSIVEPRIPSPTLSMPKQPNLADQGEAFQLSPIAERNVAGASPSSRITLRDYWSQSPSFSQLSQSDSLRPQPLFHVHSRSLSGHEIPSAHPPVVNSGLASDHSLGLASCPDEQPGMKRFLSLQQIGEAPSRALPSPPHTLSPFTRVRSTHETRSKSSRSKSPRPRSMESLISGTSSVLLVAGSPVARRKRSGTDVHCVRNSKDSKMQLEAAYRLPESFNSSSGPRPIFMVPSVKRASTGHPPLNPQISSSGSANDSWLARSKSSALSMALLEASIPHVDGSQPVTPEKSKSGPGAARKSRNPLDPPIVLTPSPQRYVPVYLLEKEEAVKGEPSDEYEAVTQRLSLKRQAPDLDGPSNSETRRAKPFVSGLPRSPRPQDRPYAIPGRASRRRSPLRPSRSSPVYQTRLSGNGSISKIAPSLPSKSSLEATPPRLVRSQQAIFAEPTVAIEPPEPIACGDLASQLRRMDSFCDLDEDPAYFNLTGGVCTSTSVSHTPLAEISANRGAAAPATGLGEPVYQLPPRTFGFSPRISLPYQFPHSRTPSPAAAPALTPNQSSSPADDPWVDKPGDPSAPESGYSLRCRFDGGPSGLNFSLATSPIPSPCPSPPLRSPLRRSTLRHAPKQGNISAQGSHGMSRDGSKAPEVPPKDKDSSLKSAVGVIGGGRPSVTASKMPEDCDRGGLRNAPSLRGPSGRPMRTRNESPQGNGAKAQARRTPWPEEGRYSNEEWRRRKANSPRTILRDECF